MLSVKGIYDGKNLRLDENVVVERPAEVILTFLNSGRNGNQKEISERQIRILKKGYRMGSLKFHSRDELHER